MENGIQKPRCGCHVCWFILLCYCVQLNTLLSVHLDVMVGAAPEKLQLGDVRGKGARPPGWSPLSCSGSLSPPHLLCPSFPLHCDLMSPFLVRIPLEIPAVGTSEIVSPATCVISEADNYVTFVCEQSKAKIIYKKVLLRAICWQGDWGRHIWKISTWKCSFFLHGKCADWGLNVLRLRMGRCGRSAFQVSLCKAQGTSRKGYGPSIADLTHPQVAGTGVA